MSKTNYGKRLIEGGTLIFISVIVIRLLGVLRSGIIARYLGPSELGILSILNNILDIVLMVATLSLPLVITKLVAEYNAKSKKKVKQLISCGLLILILSTLCISIVLFILAPHIATFYDKPELLTYLYIYATFMFIMVALQITNAIIRGFHKMNYLSIFGMVSTIINLPILLLFVSKYGVLGVVISSIITAIIGLSLSIYGLSKTTKWEIKDIIPKFDLNTTKRLLLITLPLFLGMVIFRPVNLLIKSYIYIVLSPVDVGYYHVAFIVYSIILMIPASIQAPLLPLISEVTAKKGDISKLTTNIFNIMSKIMLPISAITCLLSGPIIYIIYGNQYLQVTPILAVFCGASYFFTLTIIHYSNSIGTGKTWVVLFVDLIQAILLIGIIYAVLPTLGLIGGSMAYLIVGVVVLIIYSIVLHRLKTINSIRTIKNVFIGGVVISICVLISTFSELSPLFLTTALILSVLIVITTWVRLNVNEKIIIKNLLKQLKNTIKKYINIKSIT